MSDAPTPWAAMLKLAGVSVAEIADLTGLGSRYIYKQLRGEMPMQYRVERACKHAIGAKQDDWYPAAAAMIRLLHDWSVSDQVREVMR